MKHILLVCSAGMSTSMLVAKMQEAAQKEGLEVDIIAVSEAEAAKNIEVADVVLLGPQIRFMLNKLKAMAGDKPVDVINMADYGTMNGAKVLKDALDKIGGE